MAELSPVQSDASPASRMVSQEARELCRLFRRRFRVLVADDDDDFLFLLDAQLGLCPVLQIDKISTLEQLQGQLANGRIRWYCWLLDMIWGTRCVLDLFPTRIPFPFTLLMSGLATRRQVSEGMVRGALYTFDKDPLHMQLRSAEDLGVLGGLDKGQITTAGVVGTVVRVCVVRWLLADRDCDLPDAFRVLAIDTRIVNLKTWANSSSVEVDALESVCRRYCHTSPGEVLTYVLGVAHAAVEHVLGQDERLPVEQQEAGERALRRLFASHGRPVMPARAS